MTTFRLNIFFMDTKILIWREPVEVEKLFKLRKRASRTHFVSLSVGPKKFLNNYMRFLRATALLGLALVINWLIDSGRTKKKWQSITTWLSKNIAIFWKQKFLVYMRKPQNSFEPNPDPKNSPLGPQKVKNDPKIKSKSKVRIQEDIENKSCSATWGDSQTVFEPPPPWPQK